MRVLVVEDHAKLAMAVAAGLRREGMAVDVAFDGHDALGHAASTDYEVIVLDRDIPGVHGDEVCRQLIDDGCESRVLMLTAAGTIKDRVEGLQLGADDYLRNPSTSPNSWLASRRSLVALALRCRRCWYAAICSWTRPIEWLPGRDAN